MSNRKVKKSIPAFSLASEELPGLKLCDRILFGSVLRRALRYVARKYEAWWCIYANIKIRSKEI